VPGCATRQPERTAPTGDEHALADGHRGGVHRDRGAGRWSGNGGERLRAVPIVVGSDEGGGPWLNALGRQGNWLTGFGAYFDSATTG
jgi:hypothetical protein